jgi:hypothetical protein
MTYSKSATDPKKDYRGVLNTDYRRETHQVSAGSLHQRGKKVRYILSYADYDKEKWKDDCDCDCDCD